MQSCEKAERGRFKEVVGESSKLLNVKLEVLAIDSTGLREDNASCYYAKKSGKKRKSWTKMTIVVDVESQMILSEDVRVGPGIDGVVLREMFDRGDIPSCEILLADSGYDCRGVTRKLPYLNPLEEVVAISLKKELTSSSDGYSAVYQVYMVRDGQLKRLYQSSNVDSVIALNPVPPIPNSLKFISYQ